VKYLGQSLMAFRGATESFEAGLGAVLVIDFGYVRIRCFHFR
jgi:hypothetical protein